MPFFLCLSYESSTNGMEDINSNLQNCLGHNEFKFKAHAVLSCIGSHI